MRAISARWRDHCEVQEPFSARMALRRMVRKSPMVSWADMEGAEEGLPGRLGDAGNLAVEGELAESDAGKAVAADERARAAGDGATVAQADGRGVAGQLGERA